MTKTTKPAEATTTEEPVITWQVVVIERTRTKLPPPQWALDTVKMSWDKKIALGSTFVDEKAAKAALHQLRRAAEDLGFGLSAQQLGVDLRIQAKVKKAPPAAKAAA